MRIFPTLADLAAEQGTEIGASDWLLVDQKRIDNFAESTGDHQWIHVDPERVRRELDMPTIAHGYLTLSLVPHFLNEILEITSVKRTINYGANKIRFTNMVPSDSRLRGRLFLTRAVHGGGSLRAISRVTVDIEGEEKPALTADTITLFYE